MEQNLARSKRRELLSPTKIQGNYLIRLPRRHNLVDWWTPLWTKITRLHLALHKSQHITIGGQRGSQPNFMSVPPNVRYVAKSMEQGQQGAQSLCPRLMTGPQTTPNAHTALWHLRTVRTRSLALSSHVSAWVNPVDSSDCQPFIFTHSSPIRVSFHIKCQGHLLLCIPFHSEIVLLCFRSCSHHHAISNRVNSCWQCVLTSHTNFFCQCCEKRENNVE